ncbi:MAG TPA: cell division protein ZapA [Candidatus Binataceae bacterium]|jgi:cell division protein ZapA|nr:cell division protein ZapA [Candidatus Binataceae bacterium]
MRGVNVEIMGQNLVVASDGGDDWAKTLAATVDEKIRTIRANSQSVNSVNLVILAALNFADELERLRRDHQALLSRLETLSQRLFEAVDQ